MNTECAVSKFSPSQCYMVDHINWLINTMRQSRSWKVNSHSAGQEIPMPFMEPAQAPATGLYPELEASVHTFPTLSPKNPF
jgi:hypothetical protein